MSTVFSGPHIHEARAAFERAIEAGLSTARAQTLAETASYKDGWIFRRNIARRVGCSERTVSRAFADGRRLGLLRTWRAKAEKEIPPGMLEKTCRYCKAKPGERCAHRFLRCGWSHRVTVGWGLAGAAIQRDVDAARARYLVSHAFPAPRPRSPQPRESKRERSALTREELEERKRQARGKLAELEKRWANEEALVEIDQGWEPPD